VAQQNANDLSAAEALDLLNAGLALMPVQHVRGAGWIPTAALGASDGVHAAYHAFVIGFAPGVNVWCDLEGVQPGASAQHVIDYCNSWYDAVNAAGYVAPQPDRTPQKRLVGASGFRSAAPAPPGALRCTASRF
jgi:hypothetical protein